MQEKEIAIGADIGGSHISCAAIDIVNRTILGETYSEQKVDNQAGSEEILNGWALALESCIDKIPGGKLAGIGFAMPGPFDYIEGIAKFEGLNSKFEKLYNVNVKQRLKALLSLDEAADIRFMNDASSFAVGEAWMGKASGYRKSLAITLGTGFGSAFIENGLPVVEGESVPENGCVWHLKYRDDIADGYISTRWLTNAYEKRSGKSVPGVKEISEAVSTDPVAASLFEEYGNNLAEILNEWIEKFEVEVIVMGGNISNAYHHFGPNFEKSMSRAGLNPVVKISELKEDAAIIGSARLLEEGFWKRIKPILSYM
jgi:glucokinase